MKIVLPGGSGQIGTILARSFLAEGHDVVTLSRRSHSTVGRAAAWDGQSQGPWVEELEGADVVINLAGRSVDCRYHAANRRETMQSRLRSTRAVGAAIESCALPPAVWLQASTATLYAHRYDAANDEENGILGGEEPETPDTWRFSIDVAKAWESEATRFALPRTRLVLLRSAMTMSPDAGGVFDVLLRLVRLGMGGTIGDGRQYVSWIHERDFVRAIHWLISHGEFEGSVNLASPNPIPMAEFLRTLRQVWGIRFGLPATRWMLEIAAFFLRTESELVLKSRRVVPGRLLRSGFAFEFSEWRSAAEDLCRQWRARRLATAAAADRMSR